LKLKRIPRSAGGYIGVVKTKESPAGARNLLKANKKILCLAEDATPNTHRKNPLVSRRYDTKTHRKNPLPSRNITPNTHRKIPC
jgi:hypothetical protein